jgi:ribosomal protein L37AE/L43A
MSTEQSSKTAERQDIWKCEICGKAFDNMDMLNYHNLLEHSEHKRPPIGIG